MAAVYIRPRTNTCANTESSAHNRGACASLSTSVTPSLLTKISAAMKLPSPLRLAADVQLSFENWLLRTAISGISLLRVARAIDDWQFSYLIHVPLKNLISGLPWLIASTENANKMLADKCVSFFSAWQINEVWKTIDRLSKRKVLKTRSKGIRWRMGRISIQKLNIYSNIEVLKKRII